MRKAVIPAAQVVPTFIWSKEPVAGFVGPLWNPRT